MPDAKAVPLRPPLIPPADLPPAYAQIAIAEREAMNTERPEALGGDLKPTDLAPDQNVAFDVAYKLVRGSTLPEPLYRLAVDRFGQQERMN